VEAVERLDSRFAALTGDMEKYVIWLAGRRG
jgi:hypothetical protein